MVIIILILATSVGNVVITTAAPDVLAAPSACHVV
jgi:hypothetical protein